MTDIKEKKDKIREKAKGFIKDLVQEELQTLKADLSTAVEDIKKDFSSLKEELVVDRKIKFDPAEAKAPYVTSGKLGDSKGYSFLRVIQAQLSRDWKLAKSEYGIHQELVKAGFGSEVDIGYWITPLSCSNLPGSIAGDIKSMMRAGLEDIELKDIQKFMMAKALGLSDDSLGGYLVEPVQAPEIIELLRPQVVVQRAGAQEMPLPPSGELTIPKQTGDVDAQWVGENTNLRTTITTNAAFGQLVLKAKKLATFQILSNELVTSSTPAAEAIIRRAMAKKISEKEDQTWLEGAGTSVVPMGIINHSSVTSYSASSTGANGDLFYPQDVQLMIAEVEENNAVMEAWIMRPQMLGVIVTWRANQGTANAGEFMFDIVKDPASKVPYLLGGYPVYTTTQVSGSRVKGTGTTLTYILAGMFSEAIIGRKATLEIKASAEAGTSFENDQVWLRGITRSDFGLRHPAAFVFCDQVKQSHS